MNLSQEELILEIKRLKKEKNAIILAHFYQTGDIQDIADYIGDSLGLAQMAEQTDADMIVFAGVHFMAETAKILNPSKKVVLPDIEAGCSLAASCPAGDFSRFKDAHPDHIVISYINCTADIKTLSDYVCTSSNAVKLVESFPMDQKIIFAPDKNLGGYINKLSGRNMVLWDGTCEVHDILSTERLIQMKMDNPDAEVVAHPECKAPILELANFVGSTTAMINYCKKSENKKFIVATESGIIHQMQKDSPDKEFLIVPSDETCACNDCPYMKLNTMEKLYLCMKNETPEIILPQKTIERALVPIVRMMDISKKLGII